MSGSINLIAAAFGVSGVIVYFYYRRRWQGTDIQAELDFARRACFKRRHAVPEGALRKAALVLPLPQVLDEVHGGELLTAVEIFASGSPIRQAVPTSVAEGAKHIPLAEPSTSKPAVAAAVPPFSAPSDPLDLIAPSPDLDPASIAAPRARRRIVRPPVERVTANLVPEATPLSLSSQNQVGSLPNNCSESEFVALYNSDLDAFQTRFHPDRFCRKPSSDASQATLGKPSFVADHEGDYWVVTFGPSIHNVVPYPGVDLDETGRGRLGSLFQMTNAHAGYSYKRMTLIWPATLRDWQLTYKGSLKLEDGGSDVDAL